MPKMTPELKERFKKWRASPNGRQAKKLQMQRYRAKHPEYRIKENERVKQYMRRRRAAEKMNSLKFLWPIRHPVANPDLNKFLYPGD